VFGSFTFFNCFLCIPFWQFVYTWDLLKTFRQASVALNVWQPEVIRGRQKQIVEQCSVPVDSRINVLEMELKLCKQQIVVFEKAYVRACFPLHYKNVLYRFIEWMFSDPVVHFVWCQRDEKQRLKAAKEQLSSMMYHPLQDLSMFEQRVGDHSHKRKKLKTDTSGKVCISCCVFQYICSNQFACSGPYVTSSQSCGLYASL